ncbi:guanine nucleotide-binding protein G(o) subunit alpha [Acrasis kona]|uniref:Guanine nucleotide-binding protein G(O) subunit alpha n=1 Tax=Acrasis kona TaxID=1008807 RepID=A0AAW2Z7F9_9EUKA
MGNLNVCLREQKPDKPSGSDQKEKKVKILLLGPGDSGKSTLFKQIKIINNNGYTEEELYQFKNSIYANIITAIKSLAEACLSNNIPFDNEENLEAAKRVIELADSDTSLLLSASLRYTESVANDIERLARDSTIRHEFKSKRYDYHVFEGATYFFEDLSKVRPPNYTPSFDDILHCRRKTTGIIEVEFTFENCQFKLYDVGGQRNERKKWIHHFQGVDCVIFVASMSDFDQKCYEDDVTNRMVESLDLFDEIVNGSWFKDTVVILFLNKTDIFRNKIQNTDLRDCFPDYTGGCDYLQAEKYILQKYLSLNKFSHSRIYSYFTNATNPENVKDVFEKVKRNIVDNNLPKPL